MSHELTTKNPDEVKAAFALFANLLDTYANDQAASLRFQGTKREKQFNSIREKVYRDLANEVREIKFIQEPEA
jgi:hypothetical protein